MPDFASTTTPTRSIACFSGPSASSAAVAEKDDAGAGGPRRLVSDELRHSPAAVSIQARIEGHRVTPGERVGADRVKLELAMHEHAVEHLLPRVAGRADDRDVGHLSH